MSQKIIEGFRLSSQQDRLWAIQSGDEISYRTQGAFLFDGSLGLESILAAVEEIVRRSEILRTQFHRLPGMLVPLQVIGETRVKWGPVRDLSFLAPPELQTIIETLFDDALCLPFDLENGAVIHGMQIILSANKQILLLSLPALCADRGALRCLSEEVCRIAASEDVQNGQAASLQYADYCEWQHELLQTERTQLTRDMWRREELQSCPRAPLASERARTEAAEFQPRVLDALLDARVLPQINLAAIKYASDVTDFLLACWQICISILTSESELLMGVVHDGRRYSETAQALGLFARTLPLRCHVSGDMKFDDLLAQVRTERAQIESMADYLVWDELVQSESGNKFAFDWSVEFQEELRQISCSNVSCTVYKSYSCIDRFKLHLLSTQKENCLAFELYYDSSVLVEVEAARILQQFQTLVSDCSARSSALIVDLNVLSASERRELLVDWNFTATEYPNTLCIHERFEQQVEQALDDTAVVFESESLSYRELNQRANQLAHFLRGRGVSHDVPVALCVERSLEMVVALLGIQKAGGAYVPLDPNYPLERLSSMQKDSASPVLLTLSRLLGRLPEDGREKICLDSDWEQISRYSTANGAARVEPANLAYIIYTSGSTGQPKGAMISHHALGNHMSWMQRTVALARHDRVLQKTSYSFDASVWEFYLPLFVGAQLVLAIPGGQQDPLYLLKTVREMGITHLQLVPSLLERLVENDGLKSCPSLESIFCGGEALPQRLQQAVFQQTQARLFNLYGPTETTIDATFWQCSPENKSGSVPIGKPIDNTQIYVLNEGLHPVPGRVAGELYIGGEGLARGYWRRPDLTAERFLPDPFSEEPGRRIYKSGDRARWMEDGVLEFLGRRDDQVKIRGFRIELAEIESALRSHPEIREAAVLAREVELRGAQLVAYCVLRREAQAGAQELRNYLERYLPNYMVPSYFQMLDELPLTLNGKLDRQKLLRIDLSVDQRPGLYVAPRNEIERLLADIWQEVLGTEQVSIRDNFFDLGGHSLMATQLISRVRALFQVELPLRVLFHTPTIEGLAVEIGGLFAHGPKLRIAVPKPASRGEKIPLSFAQQRLWFMNELEPENPFYNVATGVEIIGALDEYALQESLDELVRRHESLRTTFAAIDGDPVQRISPVERADFKVTDLRSEPQESRKAVVLEFASVEARRPFDLVCGPLMRARLLRTAEQESILLLTMHHIVGDGWSLNLIIRELTVLYDSLVKRQPHHLPELKLQYADYAIWQREWLSGEVLDVQIAYWKERLANSPTNLQLPSDRPRPTVQTFRGGLEKFEIPAPLTMKLKAAARQQGVTMNMILFAAFKVLLKRYSGQSDLVVGTPIANRTWRESEALVGCLVNTLVIRTNLEGNPTFRELLERVREVMIGAYVHQDLPFERLVDELKPVRDLGRHPLFQVMFAFQNAPEVNLRSEGLNFNALEVEKGTVQFDWNLAFTPSGDSILGDWQYSEDLFEASTIRRMSKTLQCVLQAITADIESRIDDVELLTANDRRQIEEWNTTTQAHEGWQSIHWRFEQQVEKTPNHIAVIYEDHELSFRDLNRRANQVAHFLNELGVSTDQPVGLCVDRSVDLIVGLLGIQKAGGAYVPLDPEYPVDRLAFMLADARVEVLLTQEHQVERLPTTNARIVRLDADWEEISGKNEDNLAGKASGDSLAYIIYTSGSTGNPKGTMVPHRALGNHMRWMQRNFPLEPHGRVLQKTSYGFDASVWEIYQSLLEGGTLVLAAPGGQSDPLYLIKAITKFCITRLQLVPSMLAQLLLTEGLEECESLTHVFCGGEVLQSAIVSRFFELLQAEIHNLYGPTETTIDVTSWTCSRNDGQVVPVGRPIDNTQLYVLNTSLRIVPVGGAGDLYIGGENLARGYLNRPDLTAERFLPNPFSRKPGARIYRSGDVARWMANGALEYLGRSDHQIKLRGYRVELGEIEAVLQSHQGVKETAVLVRDDESRGRGLIAFVMAAEECSIDSAELRKYLRSRLPEHMVPASLTILGEMPRLPNGKLDRQALAKIPWDSTIADESYEGPSGSIQQLLVVTWQEVLGIDRVGVRDNFFELGGDSILSIQVIARLRREGYKLTLKQLFEHQTIADLAPVVTAISAEPALAQEPEPPVSVESGNAQMQWLRRKYPSLEHAYPLSPMQQGLVFQTLYAPNEGLYLVQLTMRLCGLNAEHFRRAWSLVVERHEILRTALPQEMVSAPLQVVLRDASLFWDEQDWRNSSASSQEVQLQEYLRVDRRKDFDFEQAPLMRCALIRVTEHEFQFVWTHHHVLLDGWSRPILLKEVVHFYEALGRGEEADLPRPRPYRDYIAWLEQQDEKDAEIFWREELRKIGTPARLPFSGMRGDENGVEIEERCQLSLELSNALRGLARSNQLTLNAVFEGAVAIVLGRLSNQESALFGTVVSGRPPEMIGVESMVGAFINTIPMHVHLSPQMTVLEWLEGIHKKHFQSQPYDYTPLIKILAWSEQPANVPLFETVLAFQNFPSPAAPWEQSSKAEVQVLSFEGTEKAHYPLLVRVAPRESIDLMLTCDSGRLSQSMALKMMDGLQQVLEGLVRGGEGRVGEIEIVTEGEREQLRGWNERVEGYERGGECIHERFEEQARRRPDAVAVASGGQQVSYGELNRRANQLGHYLRRLGVGAESLVGLCLERGVELVVGVLGIQKAGGAYVPLDGEYPQERMRYMLEDAGVGVVVTEAGMKGRLPEFKGRVVSVDEEWGEIEKESGEEEKEKRRRVEEENLAYVIYTSGSTGRPKGMQITHRNVMRLLAGTEGWFRFGSGDTWTMFHSYGFDFSVWEMYGALLHGGRLVMVPYWQARAPEEFYQLLEQEQVTVLNQTPTAFWQLAEVEERKGKAGDLKLRWVIFGGEALEPERLRGWYERHGEREPVLVNMYGITETTVHVTYREMRKKDSEGKRGSVVGVRIPDLRLYLLDEGMRQVPIGVTGEIYVGGEGLGRGYLNRADLTAERFVPDGYGGEWGGRMYRSGDQGRWEEGGGLRYEGRKDEQVKIRGFRIELGEIETQLREHGGVADAVVMVKEEEGRGKQLVGYIVEKARGEVEGEELRRYMQARIPEYMVPGQYRVVEELPRTSNGKLDRGALARMEWEKEEGRGAEYAGARSEAERVLVEAWEEVLGVKGVGIHDNFFTLGGDSILSIQIVSKAAQRGMKITVRQIFEETTIAGLARVARYKTVGEGKEEEGGRKFVLTPIQRRYFELELGNVNHYNQAVLLQVEGGMESGELRAVVAALLRQHDGLRLRFERGEGGWEQSYGDGNPEMVFGEVDLSGEEGEEWKERMEEFVNEAQRSLNIERGPLLRVVLFRLGEREKEEKDRLLVVVHHLAVDGVSWRILLEDLQRGWEQAKRGGRVELGVRSSSYREWAEGLVKYGTRKEVVEEEVKYWLGVAAVQEEEERLPEDYEGGENLEEGARTVTVRLSGEQTRELLQEVPKAYGTQIQEVLLTAVGEAVSEWRGGRRVVVDVEGHGREEIGEEGMDVTRTVGWFTTIYPVVLELPGPEKEKEKEKKDGEGEGRKEISTEDKGDLAEKPEWGASLQAIQAQMRSVPKHGIGYGVLKYLGKQEEVGERLRKMPAAQISFNYLGQFDQVLGPGVSSAPESSGDVQDKKAKRDYLININGMVLNGALSMTWSYSSACHRPDTIEKITDNFIQTLEKIISSATLSLRQPKEGSRARKASFVRPEIASARGSNSLVVGLRTSGANPPFFSVSTYGDDPAFIYRDIAQELGSNYPFYGLWMPEDEDFSFVQLASSHVEEIRRIQPHGPYFVGGYSLGGVVAFEIARQLEAMREHVGLLVLFETVCPTIQWKLDSITDIDLLYRIARSIDPKIDLPPYVRGNQTVEDQIAAAYARLRNSPALPPGMDVDGLKDFLRLWRRRADYEPRPYSGQILLFRTEDTSMMEGQFVDLDQVYKEGLTESLGWSLMAPETLTIEPAPGAHANFICNPHSRIVAGRLKGHLHFDASPARHGTHSVVHNEVA